MISEINPFISWLFLSRKNHSITLRFWRLKKSLVILFTWSFSFFHFRGNSLRLVHVFWRLPEKTSHPFFEPEMGVLTLFSKKGQKRPKGREEKKFSLPRKGESTKKTGKKKNFPFPGRENFFPFPGRKNDFSSRCLKFFIFFFPVYENVVLTFLVFVAFFGLCSPWNIH